MGKHRKRGRYLPDVFKRVVDRALLGFAFVLIEIRL